MESQKVSVIIPIFNGKKFLTETIESVFAQAFTDWELLLVDDGSTDGSDEIAINYANKYPQKVRFLYHEGHQNRGHPATRNLGYKKSEGDIFLFLDQDDVLLPQSLEIHVSTLELHPEVDVLFGESLNWLSWTQNPEDQLKDYIWEPWKAQGIQPNTIIQPPRLLNLLLCNEVMPNNCSLLLRRHALDLIGGWPEDVNSIFDDQVLYVKLFIRATVYIAAGYQEKYRLHDDSLCSVFSKEGKTLPSKMFFLNWAKEYLSAQGFHDAQIEQYLTDELKKLIKTDYTIAKQNFPFL